VLTVLKLGGSVLRDDRSYAASARFLQQRLALAPQERLVVIVSAQYGATDALHAEAQIIANDPCQLALDLLWSTGELRSVALLALHLQRIGVSAVPFNVHQTGLVADREAGTTVRPMRLLAALAHARIVIVPDRGKEADAEAIARELTGAWVEMPSDTPANYDANDYEAEYGVEGEGILHSDAVCVRADVVDHALVCRFAGGRRDDRAVGER